MSLNVTLYDLYTAEDREKIVDPLLSGRTEEISDRTVSNVIGLVTLFAGEQTDSTILELQRLVKTTQDNERNFVKFLERCESSPNVDIQSIVPDVRAGYQALLEIGRKA